MDNNGESRELEYLPRKDIIKEEMKLIGEIGYKPIESIIIVSVSGLIILALARNLFGIITCALFVGLSGFIYLVVKDHKVIEIYDGHICLVDVRDDSKVASISFDQIKSYSINKNNSNLISIILHDGRNLQTMTFQRTKASRLFRKVLPGKSEEEIRMEELKNMKSSGFSILKRFRK